jgi:hypothetical protein
MHPLILLTIVASALQRLSEALVLFGRAVLGWGCVVVGIVITISPIPFGFLLVIMGVILLGARNRGLRMARVAWKRLLRRWAALPLPVVSAVGQRLQQAQQSLERRMRLARAPSGKAAGR